VCFDLLHFAGVNLRGNAYVDRRRYRTVPAGRPVTFSSCTHPDNAEALYAASLESGFEGIVAKRRDGHHSCPDGAPPVAHNQGDQHVEFVIGAVTQGGRALDARRGAARVLGRRQSALRRSRGIGSR
jgi:bifunctional non-homologous end joining protein LigD